MFTNSIAIESSSKPAPTDRMDVTESMPSKTDFTAITDAQLHTGSGLDNGHIQKASVDDAVETQQQQTVRRTSPMPIRQLLTFIHLDPCMQQLLSYFIVLIAEYLTIAA